MGKHEKYKKTKIHSTLQCVVYHQMEVCGPVNALATQTPGIPLPFEQEAGWSPKPAWMVLEKRKFLYFYQDLNHGPPSLQLVATLCYPSQFLPLVKKGCTQHFIYKYLYYTESNLKLINVHVQWDLILTRLLYITRGLHNITSRLGISYVLSTTTTVHLGVINKTSGSLFINMHISHLRVMGSSSRDSSRQLRSSTSVQKSMPYFTLSPY